MFFLLSTIVISTTTAQSLKARLENGTDANHLNYNHTEKNVRIGTLGHLNYKLTLSDDNGTSRMAFMNFSFPEDAVLEYSQSKKLRFQRWNNSIPTSTILTMDFDNDNVGIHNDEPQETFHVDGTIGIGKFSDQLNAGVTVDYIDGGTGTMNFKFNRYGGTTGFMRNSATGLYKQIDFGGTNNHFLNIYDGDNESKIRFKANSTSYFNGGTLILGGNTSYRSGGTRPDTELEVHGDIEVNEGSKMFFGAKNDEDGYLRMFNNGKISMIDYSENFYIRKATINQNDGAVMGFQKDGTVTIGIWENGNGDVVGDGSYKLQVNGAILCERVRVIADVPNSDHVFEDCYELRPLEEVEAYVKTNKHLPEVPSAKEFIEEGYSIGEMDDLLLRKVEELTLYVIELQKEIKELQEDK